MKKLLAIAKILYANRKAEIALVLGLAAVVREVVQAASGH
jgi:hypothetical protein